MLMLQKLWEAMDRFLWRLVSLSGSRAWELSSLYVARHKSQLEMVARELELSDLRPIRVYLDPKSGCARLLALNDRATIAEVYVHGECGSPYKATVKTNLPDMAKRWFVHAFPFPVEFQPLA